MKDFLKILLFLAAAALFFSSSLVSAERKCPESGEIDQGTFLSAHGLNKDNFSIWLKEHSVWREKYSDDLKNYSFIPQKNDKEKE